MALDVNVPATPSFGTILRVSNGQSPDTFYAIKGVRDITGPSRERTMKDVTPHDAISRSRRKVATLLDNGEISFMINYNPIEPTHSDISTYGLGKLFNDGTRRKFSILGTDPSSTRRDFYAYVTKFSEKHDVDGTEEREVTLTIDGDIDTI